MKPNTLSELPLNICGLATSPTPKLAILQAISAVIELEAYN